MKKLLLTALFTLSCVTTATAQDFSVLPDCVSEQSSLGPINKIEVNGYTQGYALLELHQNKNYHYPLVVKMQPNCRIVWVNPDNSLFAIGGPLVPPAIAQELINQRLRLELKELKSLDALFAKYNARYDAGYLWMTSEELKGLKELGYRPKHKVKTSEFSVQ